RDARARAPEPLRLLRHVRPCSPSVLDHPRGPGERPYTAEPPAGVGEGFRGTCEYRGVAGAYRRAGLVPAVGLPEGPGTARAAVTAVHVVEAPLDLGRRVGLPVGARGGHLGARERLD